MIEMPIPVSGSYLDQSVWILKSSQFLIAFPFSQFSDFETDSAEGLHDFFYNFLHANMSSTAKMPESIV